MKVEIRQNVIDALVKLRDKDARRVINEALNTSVRILRKETVQNFKRGVTKSGKKIVKICKLPVYCREIK